MYWSFNLYRHIPFCPVIELFWLDKKNDSRYYTKLPKHNKKVAVLLRTHNGHIRLHTTITNDGHCELASSGTQAELLG